MTKSRATFLLTPPQREAVIELARAYVDWWEAPMPHEGGTAAKFTIEASQRLLAAQDALGIELINREKLISFLNQEAA